MAEEPDLRSDHTKAMQLIAQENRKIPKVDSNGRVIDGEPDVWTFDDAGNPVKSTPPPAAADT